MSLVMDMEAGLEHLGRGTAQHLGALLIVTEPTAVSARTASRIARLGQGLGLRLPGIVVNKASSPGLAEEIRPLLAGLEVIGTLPLDPAVAASEAVPVSGPFVEAVEKLRARLGQRVAS
jgi:CO dehydrogenase maturation factor